MLKSESFVGKSLAKIGKWCTFAQIISKISQKQIYLGT